MVEPMDAAECWLSGSRLRHTRAVAAQGLRLFPTDALLVEACWLHDIGYAPEAAVTGMHALDGALWCRRAGYDEEVVSLVAWHTGAWFEARERGLLAQVEGLGVPPSQRLDALTLCDLTSSPTGVEVAVPDRISEILNRYSEDDVVHRAVTRSQSELVASCQRAIGRLGLAEGWGLTAR